MNSPKQPFHILFDQGAASKHLGELELARVAFTDIDEALSAFETRAFKALNEQEKSDAVSRALLELLLKEEKCTFLLLPLLDFLERIRQKKVLEHYSFLQFELWLNQFSGLSFEHNYLVRARIVGKHVPRETYQLFFPIGMGKSYPGTHYVTAHSSPDLDTTVASFWGWIDAFGAKVADGLHIWNLPGTPNALIELSLIFRNLFGKGVFDFLAKTKTTLTLSSLDLMNQRGVVKKKLTESTLEVDHEKMPHAVIVVDEQGYYAGDWRNIDVEGVNFVLFLLNQSLHWFQKELSLKLIALFSKDSCSAKDFSLFFSHFCALSFEGSAPLKAMTTRQKQQLDDYLKRVLAVERGISAHFAEFMLAMEKIPIDEFVLFKKAMHNSLEFHLFENKGDLTESRRQILQFLEKAIGLLDNAIVKVSQYVQRLDVALDIKREVFGRVPHPISHRADLEEIKNRMGSYPYLTVTYSDEKNRQIPLGVIHATDLYRPYLGTVTLRDFCNREETKIPPHLEIISVIDHHKCAFSTSSVAVVNLSDAQSSNAVVAEIAFRINDQYSSCGMDLSLVEAQIKEVSKDLSAPAQKRILQRLLQKQLILERSQPFYVAPMREFIEYLHFLYAILDDTDLLSKVTERDVECVASLLNRLKSLALRKEVEIISLDGIARDEAFAQKAAGRILQNVDMYSLCRKIYSGKEESVEQNILSCSRKENSAFFSDTKEQNGCCRVGQSKMFAKNFVSFSKQVHRIRAEWVTIAKQFHANKPEFDLHLHMISTISGPEDLFAGLQIEYTHRDELWFWIPMTEMSITHLKGFLSAFGASKPIMQNAERGELELELFGEQAKELDQIFTESFLPIARKIHGMEKEQAVSVAVLRYRASSINSRKAMVSPYLPK